MAKYRINYQQRGLCEIYNTEIGKYVPIECSKVPQRVQRGAGAPTFPNTTRSVASGSKGAETPVETTQLPGGGVEVTTADKPGEPTGTEGLNILGHNISASTVALVLALLVLLGLIIYLAV